MTAPATATGTPSCAIIGAGPAGSTAATLLTRAGWRVDIFEKARFPRAKVCGEFISPAATDLLESLICARDLERLGARRCAAVAVEIGGRELRWGLPRAGWALSRARLDDALLKVAAEAGVRVHSPAIVRAVRYDGDAVTVSFDDTPADNRQRRELVADIVIHADGSGRHDPAGSVPIDTRLVAFKQHFQRAPEPGIVRLRSEPGAYIGTIDVEHGLSTRAWVARRSAAAWVPPPSRGAAAQRPFEHPTRAIGAIESPNSNAAGSAGAACDAGSGSSQAPPGRWGYPAGPRLACPVPRSGYVAPGHLRSFRIGNAAAAVDPVGGEGIGLAIWSATALAELLAELQPHAAPLARAQERFARLYRSRLRARLPACHLAAETLMRPRLAAAIRPALALGAAGPWTRLTGKPGRTGPANSVPSVPPTA